MSGKFLGLVIAVTVMIALTGDVSAESKPDLTVTAECGESGVEGTVEGVPGSYPTQFEIWVTDHVPSQGFWVEVPGSRQTVTANGSSVDFGPLDVDGVRDNANSIRVEQSLSPAKSESFKPCETVPTPTASPEPTPTATPSPTPPPKLTPPAFATPTPEMPKGFPDTGGEPPSDGSGVIGNGLL